jgi:hypothetical protein
MAVTSKTIPWARNRLTCSMGSCGNRTVSDSVSAACTVAMSTAPARGEVSRRIRHLISRLTPALRSARVAMGEVSLRVERESGEVPFSGMRAQVRLHGVCRTRCVAG